MLGDEVLAKERRDHAQELKSLTDKAATLEDIQTDNIRLQAELRILRAHRLTPQIAGSEDNLDQSGDANATSCFDVDLFKYSREQFDDLRRELARRKLDYKKILFSHNILQSKIRRYKAITRQWRIYVKDWALMNPDREPKPLDRYLSTPASSVHVQEHKISSASTPPAFPDIATSSMSSSPRSALPRHQEYKASNSSLNQFNGPAVREENDLMALANISKASQGAPYTDFHDGSDDLTQSPEESGERSPTSNSLPTEHSGREEHKITITAAVDDGSSPVIVSERSLKRKRPEGVAAGLVDLLEACHDATHASMSVPIKAETISGSPLHIGSSYPSGEIHDSIDLDDVGDHLTTPRKRRRMELRRLRSSTLAQLMMGEEQEKTPDGLERLEHIESSPIHIKKSEHNSHPSDENAVIAREGPIKDITVYDDEKEQEKVRRAEKKALLRTHNDRVIGRHETPEQSPDGSARSKASYRNVSGHDSSTRLPEYPTPATAGYPALWCPKGRRNNIHWNAELASPDILRTTDPNIHVLPRTSDHVASLKRPCPPSWRKHDAVAAVPVLAEDGENFERSQKEKALDVKSRKDSTASGVHYRLDALLNHPSITKALPPLPLSKDREILIDAAFSKTPQSRLEQPNRAPTTPSNMPAEERIPSGLTGTMSSPKIAGSKPARLPTKALPMTAVTCKPLLIDEARVNSPMRQPLRARPLYGLRLEDFRLNPAHSDYAYHESIRRQDEKKALSSCINPHCVRCEGIHKFIKSSGYANLPLQDRDAMDQRLIEDFLGNDTERIKELSDKERGEILTRAKSKQFADKFGKHRTPFTRSKSPIGFWDVGFPSTQEEEENRDAAKMMERQKVQERYWEAVGKGGRWIFADE